MQRALGGHTPGIWTRIRSRQTCLRAGHFSLLEIWHANGSRIVIQSTGSVWVEWRGMDLVLSSHVSSIFQIRPSQVIIGPANVFWYRWLDSALFTRQLQFFSLHHTKARRVLGQLLADTVIGSPLFTFIFYCDMTFLEGVTGKRPLTNFTGQVEQRLRDRFLPTLLSDWSFWPPVQAVNFWFLPPQFRILWINWTNFVWNIWLSHLNHADHVLPDFMRKRFVNAGWMSP
jgi:hypothetical protein